MNPDVQPSSGNSPPAAVSLSEFRTGFPLHRADDLCRPLIARLRHICGRDADSAGRYEVRAQSLTFEIDLPFRFRGTSGNTCILLGNSNQESNQALESAVRCASAFRSISLICCLTDESLQTVRQRHASLNRWCVVLSSRDLERLLNAADGRNALRKLILAQIPREQLVPFATSVPAEGPCFVGRTAEIRAMTCGDQDYALCGKGGAGKSSLLKQMKWTLRRNLDERYGRLVEVELLGITDLKEAARRIAVAIDSSKAAQEVSVPTLEPFLRRMRTGDSRFHDGPIDLVLDEMDSVLSTDRRSTVRNTVDPYRFTQDNRSTQENMEHVSLDSKYPLMQALRLARTQGIIRLTISGRTETQRMLADPDNPFVVNQSSGRQHASRLKLIHVGPLSPKEAESMLIEPLRDLNFLSDSMLPEIRQRLASCAGIPFHIADLGLDLISSLP